MYAISALVRFEVYGVSRSAVNVANLSPKVHGCSGASVKGTCGTSYCMPEDSKNPRPAVQLLLVTLWKLVIIDRLLFLKRPKPLHWDN
jgi:hypothetical protein